MGKKSKKAPNYATTSYDTGGMFGSSTTSTSGTTFKPIAAIHKMRITKFMPTTYAIRWRRITIPVFFHLLQTEGLCAQVDYRLQLMHSQTH